MTRSLLLLCALLAGTIAAEVAYRPGAAETRDAAAPPPRSAPQRPADPVGASAPDQWLSAVLARPLFTPDRRPPAHASSADPSLPRLSGIIVSTNEAVAIFQLAADGKPVVARPGTTVNGWAVTRIDADAVDLRKGMSGAVLRPRFAEMAGSAPNPDSKPRSRWEAAAPTGMLRARWSNPQLQP